MSRPRHVLIVRTDHLGDMLLALPAVHALKTAHPDCRITVLASAANAEAARHHLAVDAVEIDRLEARQARLRGTWRLARQIRRLRCDVAVVLHPRLRLALALFLAGVPVRIGTAYRGYSFLFNRRVRQRRRHTPGKHESQHNLDLLEPLGVPTTAVTPVTWTVAPDELAAIDALLDRYGARSPIVVLHPGSGGSNLNWSSAQYGELGARFATHGIVVAVTGTSAETDLTRQVTASIGGRAIDLGGQLTLPHLAALLTRSVLYVGGSTGPTHLAAAVGTPVVALYSPLRSARPERWRPLGTRVTILQPAVDLICRKCLGPRCPYYHCMEKHLSVDEAERAALEMLKPVRLGPATENPAVGPL